MASGGENVRTLAAEPSLKNRVVALLSLFEPDVLIQSFAVSELHCSVFLIAPEVGP
jgi:hypothetical protein